MIVIAAEKPEIYRGFDCITMRISADGKTASIDLDYSDGKSVHIVKDTAEVVGQYMNLIKKRIAITGDKTVLDMAEIIHTAKARFDTPNRTPSKKNKSPKKGRANR